MAYNAAQITQVDPPDQSGDQHVVVSFTGNAGEVSVQRDLTIDENTSTVGVRNWVYTTLAQLNSRKSNQNSVTVGQNIPPLAPAVAQPSAQDLWLADARRLVRMKALVDAGGLDGANAEYVALQASVKAGYQASYATAL